MKSRGGGFAQVQPSRGGTRVGQETKAHARGAPRAGAGRFRAVGGVTDKNPRETTKKRETTKNPRDNKKTRETLLSVGFFFM